MYSDRLIEKPAHILTEMSRSTPDSSPTFVISTLLMLLYDHMTTFVKWSEAEKKKTHRGNSTRVIYLEAGTLWEDSTISLFFAVP